MKRHLTVVIDAGEKTCDFCFHFTCGSEKEGKLLPPFLCNLFVGELTPSLHRLEECLNAEKGIVE